MTTAPAPEAAPAPHCCSCAVLNGERCQHIGAMFCGDHEAEVVDLARRRPRRFPLHKGFAT